MATTESRSGFRLPWSADRAPSRDGSDEDPADESQADDPERSEPELASAPANVPAVRTTPARRPAKFLIDMTHAMQAAAEQARAATLEQFRVEGSSYVEQIQGRSVADADALRRRADQDVATIKDWSKAEILRLREETENRIAGRRGQLDGQLARHAALVERDVARIEGQIAGFEAEMAAFFDELLAETDLTVLAARAQQMPEAPAFDELDDAALTALMTEPAVGIPPAVPIAAPKRAPDVEKIAEAAGPDETDGAPQSVPDGDSPALDPRLTMVGLTPDFAAAEAAAAQAAAAEIEEIPELDEANLAARLSGHDPSWTSGTQADAVPTVSLVSTQVVVSGLVSVASIASFKRHLSRERGVRHVGVSSGPDGEFVFTVQHEAEVPLRDLIPTLPGFQARVTGGGDGIVTASAHDPED